MVTVLQLVS